MNVLDIYYADDDHEDIFIFNEVIRSHKRLQELGIKVFVDVNGESLLKIIRERKATKAIVFLDINMPGSGGFNILKDIRKDPSMDHIPVIMFSTSNERGDIQKSKVLGANSYIVKPNAFDDYVEKINKILAINWADHSEDDFVI